MGERAREAGLERSRRRFIKGVLGGGVGASLAVAGGASRLAAQGEPIRSFDHVAVPMRNTDAMVRFYRALGFTVNAGAQVCSVHFGDQKINFHQPALWQREGFTLRAPAGPGPAPATTSATRTTTCSSSSSTSVVTLLTGTARGELAA